MATPQGQVVTWTKHHLFLDGKRIGGLSTDENPIAFGETELLIEHLGRDGLLYFMDTGRKGGPLTVMLAPVSPSIGYFTNRWNSSTKGKYPPISGQFRNATTGARAVMRGGQVLRMIPFPTPGTAYVATVVFQEIESFGIPLEELALFAQ